MFLNYEPEKIEELGRDFFIATGVELGVFDENFRRLNYKKQSGNRYCVKIQEKEVRLLACRRSDHELLAQCKAEGLLVNGSLSVEEISEKLGFSTQQYFSKVFKKFKGVSPAQFRKNSR